MADASLLLVVRPARRWRGPRPRTPPPSGPDTPRPCPDPTDGSSLLGRPTDHEHRSPALRPEPLPNLSPGPRLRRDRGADPGALLRPRAGPRRRAEARGEAPAPIQPR